MKCRKKQVSAMKVLLEHYQKQLNGEASYLDNCPLCVLATGCWECVWELETDAHCSNSANQISSLRKGSIMISDESLTKWRKRRIKELTAWIKKYES